MWRQPRDLPANTHGPSLELVLASIWQASKSLGHLLLGLCYIVAVVSAFIVGLATLVAGEPLELPPRYEAALQAFVVFGVACFFLEGWLRKGAPDRQREFEREMRDRLDGMSTALDARVQFQIRMMKERGEL